MDFASAIEYRREPLIAIVASLFAMLETAGDRIPRALHSAVLRILRPAESAVRRLIVAAARGIVVKPHVPLQKGQKIPKAKDGESKRRPTFQLEDPRHPIVEPKKRGPRSRPNISFLGEVTGPTVRDIFASFNQQGPSRKPKPPPPQDGCVDGRSLRDRLEAIKDALADLPKQAKRLARWRARRLRKNEKRLVYTNPLRPGRAHWIPEKRTHEVHDILEWCHQLAREAERPDTS